MSILTKTVDRYRVAQLIIAIVIETFMSLGAKRTIDEDDDDDDFIFSIFWSGGWS